MSIEYVPVAEDETSSPVEVPTEPDGTLLLSNVTAQFPGASGLRYRSPDTQALRAVRLVDGLLYRPAELMSWTSQPVYVCTYASCKRKGDYQSDHSFQAKRVDVKRCTDLIVLGLPYRADEQQLRDYFGQFGQVVMAQIKRDNSGDSRGYGFIRFRDYDSQNNCLSATHTIEGRRCEVKIPNSQMETGGNTGTLSKKIFVGGISEDLSESVLRDFFEQYGHVEDIFVPKPFRSFAFVTFSDPDVASELIGRDTEIQGVTVRLGPANPKPARGQQDQQDYGGMGAWAQYAAAAVTAPGAGGATGGSGSGNPPYQDVVNSLASNPQLLAAALQQAYQDPNSYAGAGPQQPQQQQQQQQQHQQYQNNGPYSYQQQHHQQQQPQWQ